jgi:hypothetical protein
MKTKLTFLCLKCGKTATVPIRKALVLNAVVRCYFPPKGWAILYPPQEFPARSGICDKCVAEATAAATSAE